MTHEELHEARTNPEFLNFLEEREKEAYEKDDIALFYEVLDSLMILDLQEDRINKIYEKILTISFEKIEERLKENTKLSLKTEDIYYIRSFYEHAIEKWSYGNFEGAKELFFVLANIIEDERLYDAIQVKIIACSNQMTIDEFYEVHVRDNSQLDDEEHGYFIMRFKFDTKKYLEEHASILVEEHKKLQHLLD
jgi:hypothetical protein